jgi:hypothetical protein
VKRNELNKGLTLLMVEVDTYTLGDLIERDLASDEGTPEYRAWLERAASR